VWNINSLYPLEAPGPLLSQMERELRSQTGMNTDLEETKYYKFLFTFVIQHSGWPVLQKIIDPYIYRQWKSKWFFFPSIDAQMLSSEGKPYHLMGALTNQILSCLADLFWQRLDFSRGNWNPQQSGTPPEFFQTDHEDGRAATESILKNLPSLKLLKKGINPHHSH
jgi:hypothetical protein